MNENISLTEVIAAYLQAVDAGQTPDRDEILARHPEMTNELRQFFATQEHLDRTAKLPQPDAPVVPSRRRFRMRRWAVAALTLCIVGLALFGAWKWLQPAVEESDPEQLFREMEKKLSAAGALEATINGRFETNKVVDGFNVMHATESRASLLWADGNKARFEVTITIGARVLEYRLISDGSKMSEWEKPPGRKTVTDAQKDLIVQTAGMLRRSGVLSAVFLAETGIIPHAKNGEEVFQISEFKLGTKEQVGMREGQGIEYKLSLPDGRTLPMKLWIDTETLLPLKRVVAVRVGADELQVTEIYQELRLDPPIDPERFQLPK